MADWFEEFLKKLRGKQPSPREREFPFLPQPPDVGISDRATTPYGAQWRPPVGELSTIRGAPFQNQMEPPKTRASEYQAQLYKQLGYMPPPPIRSLKERQERTKAFQSYRKAGGKLKAGQWEFRGMPTTPNEETPSISKEERQRILRGEAEKQTVFLKVFGEGLTKLPRQLGASVLQATQGQGGASVVDRDWADRFIEDANIDIEKFTQEVSEKYGESTSPIKLTDIAQLPRNLAFSITSMGGGLAVGLPTALLPVPGARVAAWVSGTTASGAVAYSMTTYQIMQEYLEAKNEEKRSETSTGSMLTGDFVWGRGLTREEENQLKVDFESKARKYGLWEAVPEAISNLAFAKILTTPLTGMVGRNIATRIVSKLGGLYGEELLTETITQKGQSAVEVEAGLREGRISWTEAFKEVAPQTFLLTTVMGGAGQVGVSAYNRAKQSLKNEIGEGHPLYETIASRLKEAVEEARARPERGAFEIPGEKPEVPQKPEVTPAPEVTPPVTEAGMPEAPAVALEITKESELKFISDRMRSDYIRTPAEKVGVDDLTPAKSNLLTEDNDFVYVKETPNYIVLTEKWTTGSRQGLVAKYGKGTNDIVLKELTPRFSEIGKVNNLELVSHEVKKGSSVVIYKKVIPTPPTKPPTPPKPTAVAAPEPEPLNIDSPEDFSSMSATAEVGKTIITKIPRRSIKDTLASWWAEAQFQMIDDQIGLKSVRDRLVKEGVQITDEEDFYYSSRLLQGNSGRSMIFLRGGTYNPRHLIDYKTKKFLQTGEPLEAILKDLKTPKDLSLLDSYLRANRDLALGNKGVYSGLVKTNIPDPPAGLSLGGMKKYQAELKAAQKALLPNQISLAKRALAELNKAHPEFKNLSNRIYEYEKSLLTYLLESQVITRATYNKLLGNTAYVPFYRYYEDEIITHVGTGRAIGGVGKQIRRLSGRSEEPIFSPLQNIVKNTAMFISAAERNYTAVLLANMVAKYPGMDLGMVKVAVPTAKVAGVTLKELGIELPGLTKAELEQIHNIFRPNIITKDGVVTILVKGKHQYFKVTDPMLAKSLLNLNREELGMLWKILSVPARTLRAGAVLFNPDFAAKNPLRDQFTAFINSNYGFIPGIDTFKGLSSLIGRGDIWKLYYASGAARSSLVSVDRDYLRATAKTLAERHPEMKEVGFNPFEALRAISEAGEAVTRIGGFRRAIEKGASPVGAGMEGKELTLDFSKVGVMARVANMIIPFFNANIRDASKIASMSKEHSIRTILRLLASITLPSLLLYAHNREDPRWEYIPQWQKDTSWIFFLSDVPDNWDKISTEEQMKHTQGWNPTKNAIIRVPKPFTWGLVFGSLPERFFDWSVDQDSTILKDWAKNLRSVMSPGIIPQALVPIIEHTTNFNLFTKSPIVPRSKEAMPPELQYTEYTSEAAKWMGGLVNTPPAVIDNYIRGYTAGMGKYVTDVIDIAVDKFGLIEARPPAKTLADVPLVRAFILRDPYGSSGAGVDEFYSRMEQLEAGEKYLKEMLRMGEEQKYARFKLKHPELLFGDPEYKGDWYSQSARVYRRTAGEISELRKLQRQMVESKSTSPIQKRQAITEINLVIEKLVRQTMKDWYWQR